MPAGSLGLGHGVQPPSAYVRHPVGFGRPKEVDHAAARRSITEPNRFPCLARARWLARWLAELGPGAAAPIGVRWGSAGRATAQGGGGGGGEEEEEDEERERKKKKLEGVPPPVGTRPIVDGRPGTPGRGDGGPWLPAPSPGLGEPRAIWMYCSYFLSKLS